MRWLSYGCFNIGVGPLRTNQIIEHNLTFLHAVLSKMYLKNDFTKMNIKVDSFKTSKTGPNCTQKHELNKYTTCLEEFKSTYLRINVIIRFVKKLFSQHNTVFINKLVL